MTKRNKINLSLQIPFRESNGNQLGYPDYAHILKPNIPFKANMFLDGMTRGRSSVKFTFSDTDGKSYEMFATNFLELVKDQDVSKGIKGEWAFCKKGQNFGLIKIVD